MKTDGLQWPDGKRLLSLRLATMIKIQIINKIRLNLSANRGQYDLLTTFL